MMGKESLKVCDVRIKNWFNEPVNSLCVAPLGDRLYKIACITEVVVQTNLGAFRYNFYKGFVTNFRSGGRFVDGFVDQIGDSVNVQVAWLVHDANYTPCARCKGEHPVSKCFADELLRAMLEFAGMGALKRNAVYYSVKWFGGSAYSEDDELTESNSKLFEFAWTDR